MRGQIFFGNGIKKYKNSLGSGKYTFFKKPTEHVPSLRETLNEKFAKCNADEEFTSSLAKITVPEVVQLYM